MRKIVSGLIIFCLLFTSSCFSRNNEQKYDKGYEDIEQQIVEKYGEYLTVGTTEYGDIILRLKKSYLSDENIYSKVPEYVLIEDIRVMVNKYIVANPNSVLSNETKEKSLSIVLTARLGSHSEKLFVVDNWHSNFGKGALESEQFFGSYWMIDISPIFGRVNDSYIIDMYDYISQSGDVRYVDIISMKSLSDEEEKAWEEEILAKFPLINEYIEHD